MRLDKGEEADRVYAPIHECGGPAADSVMILASDTGKLCLPFAASPRKLETFLHAPETGLPDRRGARERAGWASV